MSEDSRRQVAINMLEEWQNHEENAKWLAANADRMGVQSMAKVVREQADAMREEILMLMGVDDGPAATLEVIAPLRKPNPNPYEREPGQWYWWDEASEDHGPFDSQERAKRELDAYCNWLEHGNLSQEDIDKGLDPNDKAKHWEPMED